MQDQFKFQIGDMVQTKEAVLFCNAVKPASDTEYRDRLLMGYGRQVPQPYMVIGRLWEECHGGVQLHYRIRGKTDAILLYTEMELEPYGQPTEK